MSEREHITLHVHQHDLEQPCPSECPHHGTPDAIIATSARSAVPPGTPPGQYRPDPDGEDLAAQLEDEARNSAAVDELVHELLPDPSEAPRRGSATPDLDFAEAIASMANHTLQRAGLALEVVQACTGCGCTDNRACPGGCYWTTGDPGDPDGPARCSNCWPVPYVPTDPRPATIFGIPIHTDDTLEKGVLELRDPQTGQVLARMTGIDTDQPTGVDEGMAAALVAEGIPYASTKTTTRDDDAWLIEEDEQ